MGYFIYTRPLPVLNYRLESSAWVTETPRGVAGSGPPASLEALITSHYHSGTLRYVSTDLQRETFNSGSMGNLTLLMNNNSQHHCMEGK